MCGAACCVHGLSMTAVQAPSHALPLADGEVKDFVKLHNSRARARDCGYGSHAEAQLAAAAVAAGQAQETAGCKGRGACSPLVRGASEVAPGASSAADA